MPERTTDGLDPLNAHRLSRRDIGRMMSAGVAALVLPGRASAAPAQKAQARPPQHSAPPSRIPIEQQREQLRAGAGGDRGHAAQAGHRRSVPLRRGVGGAVDRCARQSARRAARSHHAGGRVPAKFCAPSRWPSRVQARPLVSASPTFESPGRTALARRQRCARFRWRQTARSISRRWPAAASGAGLAFVCNPNNPTGGINPETGRHWLRQGVSRRCSGRLHPRGRSVLRLRHRHRRTPRRFPSR